VDDVEAVEAEVDEGGRHGGGDPRRDRPLQLEAEAVVAADDQQVEGGSAVGRLVEALLLAGAEGDGELAQ